MLLLQARMEENADLKKIFKGGTITPDPEQNPNAALYEVSYNGMDFLVSNNYEFIDKVEANIDEWTFSSNTQTLTAYNGNLTEKRGNQEIGELIVPNYYDGKRVKTIGSNIFYRNTNLEKLTILDGIEKIDLNAFRECSNLSSFKLPNSLTSIGGTAFYNCNKLTGDLIIPDNVKVIGGQAFESCSSLNGKLKLEKNLQTIGASAFYSCTNLKGDIIIPNAIPSIGGWTFTGCNSLDSIKFLNRNIEIYDDNSTIPGNIEIIGYEDSTAYHYADKYSKTFREIPE